MITVDEMGSRQSGSRQIGSRQNGKRQNGNIPIISAHFEIIVNISL